MYSNLSTFCTSKLFIISMFSLHKMMESLITSNQISISTKRYFHIIMSVYFVPVIKLSAISMFYLCKKKRVDYYCFLTKFMMYVIIVMRLHVRQFKSVWYICAGDGYHMVDYQAKLEFKKKTRIILSV